MALARRLVNRTPDWDGRWRSSSAGGARRGSDGCERPSQSARRRHDEAAEARAACRLLEEMRARDQWQEARRLATALCDRLTSWQARTAVATELAAVLVAMGHLARAEVIVAAIRVEAAARREEVPRLVRVRHAEICFWSGRFEEAREPLAGCAGGDASRSRRRWVGEVGGRRGRCAGRARARRETAPGARVRRLKTISRTAASTRPARCWDARQRGRASAELEEALLSRLRDACGPAPSTVSSASNEFIRRRAARGLERWGMRRTGVHLIHAVPALLQIVHDAEDETLGASTAGARGSART